MRNVSVRMVSVRSRPGGLGLAWAHKSVEPPHKIFFPQRFCYDPPMFRAVSAPRIHCRNRVSGLG